MKNKRTHPLAHVCLHQLIRLCVQVDDVQVDVMLYFFFYDEWAVNYIESRGVSDV